MTVTFEDINYFNHEDLHGRPISEQIEIRAWRFFQDIEGICPDPNLAAKIVIKTAVQYWIECEHDDDKVNEFLEQEKEVATEYLQERLA